MSSHFEVFPRQYSVMVYGSHPENYESSCQVIVAGDRGIMNSISGAHWFRHWEKPGEVDKLLDSMGVTSLEGYATAAHARLMQRALKDVAKVTLRERGDMGRRRMLWVVVQKQDSSSMSLASASS